MRALKNALTWAFAHNGLPISLTLSVLGLVVSFLGLVLTFTDVEPLGKARETIANVLQWALDKPGPAVVINLWTDEPRVAIDDLVAISYTVSQDGWVSVWNMEPGGKVVRLYPTRGDSTPVLADKLYHLGRDNSPVRFRARAPAGHNRLVVLWTEVAGYHPPAATYSDVQAFHRALRVTQGSRSAMTRVDLEIVARKHLGAPCP